MSIPETDPIKSAIASILPESIRVRRHLHQNPELSNHERETSTLVAEKLRALELDEVKTEVGGYGVVATLKGRAPGAAAGPTFALRADMDALPIQETSELPYKSCRQGIMHACGHDGHTTVLLGAAAVLAQLRNQLPGTVKFVFQPAEETVGGAIRICDAGVMEGVDAIVALHGWPGIEVGRIGVRPGPMMASSDTFDVFVRGQGAHAAQPHLSVDPIVIAAQIVLALQAIASRETSPTEAVVVTVAQIHAGTAYNIIPGHAEIKGTIRCLSETTRASVPKQIERIAAGICAAFRADCTFRYWQGPPVTVNDGAINALVEQVGLETLGRDNVILVDAPSMGAEDFAIYMRHAPGAMFRLGVGAEVTALHTPTYNFADAALPVGMELFARTALRYLESRVQGG